MLPELSILHAEQSQQFQPLLIGDMLSTEFSETWFILKTLSISLTITPQLFSRKNCKTPLNRPPQSQSCLRLGKNSYLLLTEVHLYLLILTTYWKQFSSS